MLVYVGTMTGEGRAQGIGVFRLDERDGGLSHLHTVPAQNPSWVALHPNGRFLYAATRGVIGGPASPQGGAGGAPLSAVESFAIGADGGLTRLNAQPSGGASPCYVSVHPSGRSAYVANYASGHVGSYPLGEDGRIGEMASIFHHEGSGPFSGRQEGPHAHFITPDPTGQRVLACDLGADRVFVYRTDPAAGSMAPNDPPYAQLSAGAGPRHLAFHPNGRFVYVIAELASTLSAFAYDLERGALQIRDTRSTLPDDFTGTSWCAQVLVHPNGRFVYGSNRGHDSIAIFAIDQETGRLEPRGHASTGGQIPRNFAIDPTGRLLLAANQDSHTIVPFRINGETGALEPTGAVTQTPAPVCIVFAGER